MVMEQELIGAIEWIPAGGSAIHRKSGLNLSILALRQSSPSTTRGCSMGCGNRWNSGPRPRMLLTSLVLHPASGARSSGSNTGKCGRRHDANFGTHLSRQENTFQFVSTHGLPHAPLPKNLVDTWATPASTERRTASLDVWPQLVARRISPTPSAATDRNLDPPAGLHGTDVASRTCCMQLSWCAHAEGRRFGRHNSHLPSEVRPFTDKQIEWCTIRRASRDRHREYAIAQRSQRAEPTA